MVEEGYQEISLFRVPLGKIPTQPILDGNGLVIVPAGSEITSKFVSLLNGRGIFQVAVHSSDLEGWVREESASREVPRPKTQDRTNQSVDAPPARSDEPNAPDSPSPPRAAPTVFEDSRQPGSAAEPSDQSEVDEETQKPRRRFYYDPDRVLAVPPQLMRFARQLNADAAQTDSEEKAIQEMRRHVRFPMAMAVTVLPLDSDYNTVGDPFESVLRDLSSGGLSLLCSRAISYDFLYVEIKSNPKDPGKRMIVQVLRCLRFGRFYEVGARFVDRIHD